jgi:hypothetical protein
MEVMRNLQQGGSNVLAADSVEDASGVNGEFALQLELLAGTQLAPCGAGADMDCVELPARSVRLFPVR